MTHTLESFYGGGNARTFGASIRIASKAGRNQRLVPTSGGLKVTLPDARYFGQAGGAMYHLLNYGSFAFDVEDADANYVSTVPAGEEGVVLLSNAKERSGNYHIKLRPYVEPQTPSVSASVSATPSGTSTPSSTVSSTSTNTNTQVNTGLETVGSRTVITGPV